MVNTPRPSSLIYEVADWTRKHNRDSPSHLQGETPESSNFVCTKASRDRGPQWRWRAQPAKPIWEMMARPACVPAQCWGQKRLCHLASVIHPAPELQLPTLCPEN